MRITQFMPCPNCGNELRNYKPKLVMCFGCGYTYPRECMIVEYNPETKKWEGLKQQTQIGEL